MRVLAIDGGGVFATNPAMCAYAEAVRLTGRPPRFVLSLGTGSQTRPIPHAEAASWAWCSGCAP